jgi:hypothetical protein
MSRLALVLLALAPLARAELLQVELSIFGMD